MPCRPDWISIPEADRRQVLHLWDDARIFDLLPVGDAATLIKANVPAVGTRGRMALAAAMHEWITWRFDGLHAHAEPAQLVLATWCATVDPRYLVATELPRERWTGPVDGPLWCATTWIQHGLAKAHRFPGDLLRSLVFLARLGEHVVPPSGAFVPWLKAVLPRLAAYAPEQPADPLEDLFDDRLDTRLGPMVGHATFDPSSDPDPVLNRAFIVDCFDEALRTRNPYLAPPDGLQALGFRGVPYLVPPG